MTPIHNLRQFVDILQANGELAVVDVPVDPDQEIPEIHRRVVSANGPALLFTNVNGSSWPLASNLFGTVRRCDLAFGSRPVRFVEETARLATKLLPPTAGKLWDARCYLKNIFRVGNKRGKTGPVLDGFVQPPNLDRLPMTKGWPEDGGFFLTLPCVLTESPSTGIPNLGIYRMQRHDSTTLGLHMQIGKGGGFHFHEAENLDQPLPVSVMIGGPPALMLSAVAPLPEGVPELLLASLLLGTRLPLTRPSTGYHDIAAECDFILTGYAPPHVRQPEGPFGDHYGYYSLKHDYPVFRCEALYHRRDAIYPATVVGKPRQEDFYIGDYLQKLLSPLFPLVMPSIKDIWSFGETGFHALAAAVVQERYPREAMMSAFRILGEGQLSLTKFLLVTDTPQTLSDFPKLLSHILARFNPKTDLYVFSNLSMDTLDYTGPEVNKGSKGVMLGLGDAVRDLPYEWTDEPPDGCCDPVVFCPGCLVLGAPAYRDNPQFGEEVADSGALSNWPLVVLCDEPERCAASTINFLWTTFMRFEPAGDIYSQSTNVVRHHLAYELPMVIDARSKPWYPDELFCGTGVAGKVTDRWHDYFPGGKIEMGSSDHAHLSR
jgi:UbiD family decarboxylase